MATATHIPSKLLGGLAKEVLKTHRLIHQQYETESRIELLAGP